MERLICNEFWMCFLAQVSVLGTRFDRPLGRSLRATFMVVNDCAVLVIFTFAVDKVEMAHGYKVVHEQDRKSVV